MRCAALAILALLALAPAAHADGFDTLQGLAKRHLRPAPLVPTSAPSLFSDLGRSVSAGPGIGKGGYGLRLPHHTPRGAPGAGVAAPRRRVPSVPGPPRPLR